MMTMTVTTVCRRTVLPVLLGALALGLSACSSGYWKSKPRRGRDEIRFSHVKHKEVQVDCLSCHEEIYDANALDKSFLPPESKCMECHKEQKEKKDCAMCHKDPGHPEKYPARTSKVKIGHAKHIELVKEDCSKCHTTLPEYVRKNEPTAPMEQCFQCHEHEQQYKQGRCDVCHDDLGRYPIKPVSAFTHDTNFVATHNEIARASATPCAQCHEQTFCSECHAQTAPMKIALKYPERVERNFIHRNDWISRHGIEENSSPTTCSRCHGRSFCDDCHRIQNLTPGGKNPRSPHPRGWVSPGGGAESHGHAARNEIESCAACHDQGAASNCVECHRVGGVGGSPHPASWVGRHSRDEINGNAMCKYCHL